MSERNDNTRSAQETEAPLLGGVRLGPWLTMALYGLLTLSALLSFFGVRSPGSIPRVIEQVVPWVFLAFVIIFAFYRLGLVRAGKYPTFKAFFQIGLMLAVWVLLLPSSRIGFVPREAANSSVNPGAEIPLSPLFSDGDARIRALAAEVARARPAPERYASELARALEDSDARVRSEAHLSLVRISGNDLGSSESPDAVKAWKERYP